MRYFNIILLSLYYHKGNINVNIHHLNPEGGSQVLCLYVSHPVCAGIPIRKYNYVLKLLIINNYYKNN